MVEATAQAPNQLIIGWSRLPSPFDQPSLSAGLDQQSSAEEDATTWTPSFLYWGPGAALRALSLWWRRLQEPAGRLPIVTATSLRE
jgi:hypothetical protein